MMRTLYGATSSCWPSSLVEQACLKGYMLLALSNHAHPLDGRDLLTCYLLLVALLLP